MIATLFAAFQFDYNTRVVVTGTALLGLASGMVGVFLLLRKRALVGDAISHATLPGVAAVFLVASALGWNAKSLPILLLGAAISGIVAALFIVMLRAGTMLKEDAVLGIILSVFFGIGTALLRIIQQLPTGSSAGLESFIYGKTANMIAEDAYLIGGAALVVCSLTLALSKELKLLCFDTTFGQSQGWPMTLLDLFLMGAVVTVVIVGLQAVGLILMIALLVIPAAAARFWTHRLSKMLIIASLIGAVSSIAGSLASAYMTNLPSGPAIVIAAAILFLLSLLFGSIGGVLGQVVRRRSHRREINHQHVLRGIYEILEARDRAPLQRGLLRSDEISVQALLGTRSWSLSHVRKILHQLVAMDYVVAHSPQLYTLTASGIRAAISATRQHRMFEFYLQHQAEISAAGLDRTADFAEHVFDDDMVAELEQIFASQLAPFEVPPSPHPIDGVGSPASSRGGAA
jgi:manganese/zinc/iron transport system permease protein